MVAKKKVESPITVAMYPVVSGKHLKRKVVVTSYQNVDGAIFFSLQKGSREAGRLVGLPWSKLYTTKSHAILRDLRNNTLDKIIDVVEGVACEDDLGLGDDAFQAPKRRKRLTASQLAGFPSIIEVRGPECDSVESRTIRMLSTRNSKEACMVELAPATLTYIHDLVQHDRSEFIEERRPSRGVKGIVSSKTEKRIVCRWGHKKKGSTQMSFKYDSPAEKRLAGARAEEVMSSVYEDLE